jgi:mRNA-degrading endonuclease toxin of MazEF toxin-antitoxin module
VVISDFARRGQVWEYVQGSRQYRILIVSNDEFNELPGAVPWALIIERGAAGIPGYVIELLDKDPLPGAIVVVPRVIRCDPTALRHQLGFVTNATMNRVERGLREFLNLPWMRVSGPPMAPRTATPGTGATRHLPGTRG